MQILRLHNGDLDRQGDGHILAKDCRIHLPVMSKERNHESRKLIGSPEFQFEISVSIRIEERFEGQGRRKILSDYDIRNRYCRISHNLRLNGLFLNRNHIHHLDSGI